MQKNPKIILASGLSLALIGGVGTTVYLNSEKGNMAVSDEAADIAEKTVDQPVVDYYDTVCEELSTVTETPQNFLSATENPTRQHTSMPTPSTTLTTPTQPHTKT